MTGLNYSSSSRRATENRTRNFFLSGKREHHFTIAHRLAVRLAFYSLFLGTGGEALETTFARLALLPVRHTLCNTRMVRKHVAHLSLTTEWNCHQLPLRGIPPRRCDRIRTCDTLDPKSSGLTYCPTHRHAVQESNPHQEVWNLLCFHYTNGIWRDLSRSTIYSSTSSKSLSSGDSIKSSKNLFLTVTTMRRFSDLRFLRVAASSSHHSWSFMELV